MTSSTATKVMLERISLQTRHTSNAKPHECECAEVKLLTQSSCSLLRIHIALATVNEPLLTST